MVLVKRSVYRKGLPSVPPGTFCCRGKDEACGEFVNLRRDREKDRSLPLRKKVMSLYNSAKVLKNNFTFCSSISCGKSVIDLKVKY